ncbi:YihY/virulence factor BrkB family protein [Nocardioides iriomotensis]|uniref:YihY/virulence factor BrkB family protein n=1 Tax=Nocardioides iriomotensis TaxID=715784 RepID=A0A4Q5J2H6_9ACTN|nr:YihY/virulence factor BrkB family protein [Nocardioides iriomotensis]RYU12742.1 YihY/virulence factor BrkB family protein [Nocardioides iriomotensis]
MPTMKERATATVARVRERYSIVDHLVRMVRHYSTVNGNAQAGAVTYFGFLSFFPILALGFWAVGILAHVYPDLKADIAAEVENLLPGVIGRDEGEIPLKTFEDYGGRVGLIGLLGVLYSGLGWLSGMRSALEVMFVLPRREQPNFVFGKLRDLGTLGVIGLTLVVSVILTGLITGFSERILGWLGIDAAATLPNALLWLIGHALGVVASVVLLLAMFRLLAAPHLPRHAMITGATLGAVGFEVLKSLAGFLIGLTKGQASFQAFGVTLILVIWINYFSRLVMYAAAWSHTSPAAVEHRRKEATFSPGAALVGIAGEQPSSPVEAEPDSDGTASDHRAGDAGRASRTGLAVVGGLLALVGGLVATRRRPGR